MTEVHLYACDVCSTVKMNTRNNGITWLVMCQACKECQFHYKIVIGYRPPKDGEKRETQIIFVLEENKHDGTGKSGSNKKEE